MTAHNRGLLYCPVCKKSYKDTYHLMEHKDTHIIQTEEKLYTCTEELPNNQKCGCKYSAHGSLLNYARSAHKKGLKDGSYKRCDNVTYEMMEAYKDRQKKEPARTYEVSFK